MFGNNHIFLEREIIATIRHANVPTIVIEGNDELFLFRKIKEDIGQNEISILPVGGRHSVISSFRQSLNHQNTVPILFFCDQDDWSFISIPQEFDHPSFETTSGYSIENDLIQDGNVLSLMTEDEREAFEADLTVFVEWFAIQINRFIKGDIADIAKFPGRVLEDKEEYNRDCVLRSGEEHPADLRDAIAEMPLMRLRGKSLLQIIARYLNAIGRPARHQPKALLEFGAAANGENYRRVRSWIERSPGLAERHV